MKVLLLSPKSYSIDKILNKGFTKLGHQVVHVNYRDEISSWKNKVNAQIYRLPNKYREKWNTSFFAHINAIILEKFTSLKPDVVLVYNNEMLLPNTVLQMRKSAKVVFYLGDNPYYTPTNNYNLTLLPNADLVICPDSFWVKQLELIGLNNVQFGLCGFNDEVNYPVIPTADEMAKFKSDVFFCGNSYIDSWGYKRALFLHSFSDLNLRFYGNHIWYRWFQFFPKLSSQFTLLQKPLTFHELNLYSGCSKVYPVDANPGLLNGLHVRIFDCIASGILPLVEYRSDIDLVFKNLPLPVIDSYTKSASLAKMYIENNSLRESALTELRAFLFENYAPEFAAAKIIEKLN